MTELNTSAIEAAQSVALPELVKRKDWDDPVWLAAFDWYIGYVYAFAGHDPSVSFSMKCFPCQTIVFNALKKAKSKDQ